MTPKKPTQKKAVAKTRKTATSAAKTTAPRARARKATAKAKPATTVRRVRKVAPPAQLATKTVRVRKTAAATTRKTATKPRKRSNTKTVVEKLPEAYGTQRLFLVARDPRWLYAHWDFTREQQHAYNKLSSEGHLILRIYQETPSERLVAQVKLQTDSRHWFVPVGRGETQYIAELGYRPRRGQWITIVRSNPVLTPPETIAPDTSILLATIPPDVPLPHVLEIIGAAAAKVVPQDVPLPQVLEAIGAAVAEAMPLVESIQVFHAAGHTSLPEFSVSIPERKWTPKQARELDKVVGSQRIRKRMVGELSSLTAAQILPEPQPEPSPKPPGPTEAEVIESETAPSSPTGGWSGDCNR